MRLWSLFVAAILLQARPASSADVISGPPTDLTVTLYRDGPVRTADLVDLAADDTRGLALVIETRVVDLPAGRSRLRFEGVADGIIPQSAAIDGLPTPVIERNFDYDLLSPASLIARSVGRAVEVVRTNSRTGRETRTRATLAAGPDGVVLDFGDHREALRCGGELERLVFDHIPGDLTDRPTLSAQVESPAAGRYTVRLSYLTVRLDWSADYVAQINPDGATLALTGWITLANRASVGFNNARTEVVAGQLARQSVEMPALNAPQVQSACWPSQTTHGGWINPAVALQARTPLAMLAMAPRGAMAREVMVTAKRRVIERELGDYKLYVLAEPTTVAARQTKQVMFLTEPAVKFETVYAGDVFNGAPGAARIDAARTVLRLDNTVARGLGRPLPAGGVQVRRLQPGIGGREQLVGETTLARDTPVGQPFEINIGAAFDVTIAQRMTDHQTAGRHGVRQSFEIVATNAKATPVVVTVRHHREAAKGFKVTAQSSDHGLEAGDPVWRLTVPAAGAVTLNYTVGFDG